MRRANLEFRYVWFQAGVDAIVPLPVTSCLLNPYDEKTKLIGYASIMEANKHLQFLFKSREFIPEGLVLLQVWSVKAQL